MNYTKCILLVCLLQPVVLFAQLGSSCNSPYIIPLDGVTRTFTASSNTDGSVVCTNGSYPIKSPVTYFSFTTNASAEMPLLDITAADSSSCEIAMYTACNGGGNLQMPSSMCFDDGWGLWSPSQAYALLPNTVYHLRIKTQSATEIKITGQSNTPTNNTCAGATPVDQVNIHDNNATDKPSGEVTPLQLCAYTLENTAFYQFYIASTGAAIINISKISCDNGNNNNDNGIQIGFFTGSCGALVPLNCNAGLGPFVQATTPILNAGTKVYVAIDGNAGSNCQYELQALNAYKVLSAQDFKNFSGWETSSTNILKWISGNKNVRFVVERSTDGSNFVVVGEVSASMNNQPANYQFEDNHPLQICYYRIKQVNSDNRIALSNTLRIERRKGNSEKLKIVNPAKNDLIFQIGSEHNEIADFTIVSAYGQIFDHGKIALMKGVNHFTRAIVKLPAGHYILNVSSQASKQNHSFMKID